MEEPRLDVMLPFLPGNSFTERCKTNFRRPQTLRFRNGFAFPQESRKIVFDPRQAVELEQLAKIEAGLAYKQRKAAATTCFLPKYVIYDKKVLRFDAYFKQAVVESPNESYCVRPVKILYYLEDDTMAVNEPSVKNSGMLHGPLLKRHKLPKNDQGYTWHWKDLNVAMNFNCYGKVFRIINCDRFTADFLEDQGILLNTSEEMPQDPFIASQEKYLRRETSPSPPKKFQQFLAFDRKVLRFYCLWEEPNKEAGPPRPCVVHYFLADNTVEVRAKPQVNEGRVPFYVLLRRQRLPKILKETALFPGCVLELTDQEVAEWLNPSDLLPGRKVLILGCTLHVCDCDEFTKTFYRKNFGITDLASTHGSVPPPAPITKVLPPYNGFGSLEDSLQNCLSLIPQPPKKDYIKMLENHNKVLRYSAVLDSAIPEDKGRAFIISYHLSNDTISMFEPPQLNSGHNGGRFLERTRVIKPGSAPDAPVYYSPEDLAIGTTIEVFKHRFIIIDADVFVLRYMESQKSTFPETTSLSLQQKLDKNKASDEETQTGNGRSHIYHCLLDFCFCTYI
uniref:EF-hand domain (C-terminal) containing 1 n=1 Tax=Eptatretus burgeri TaxID=7764 RepID=A0A8C4QVF2_EPTBU